MENHMKKYISVVLCIIFALSLCTAVFAEGETSGTCGAGVEWNFDAATGTLNVTGSGKMDDQLYLRAPWKSFRDEIKKVAIASGVTYIGEMSFVECKNLESVTIPAGVTAIGEGAFVECAALKEIVIPDGVKSIGAGAFENCTSLGTVSIPKSAASVGEGAFRGCTSLKTATVAGGKDHWDSMMIGENNEALASAAGYPAPERASSETNASGTTKDPSVINEYPEAKTPEKDSSSLWTWIAVGAAALIAAAVAATVVVKNKKKK